MTNERHYLATLGYRGSLAIAGAPKGFSDFDAGQGVQKPLALLEHISDVLAYGYATLEPVSKLQPPSGTWEAECSRFFAILVEFDRALAARAVVMDMSTEELWHGPLSDAMTHVGQLTMLRRLAGCPVRKIGFVKAPVLTGKLDYRSDFA